jgi:hypothetical protein
MAMDGRNDRSHSVAPVHCTLFRIGPSVWDFELAISRPNERGVTIWHGPIGAASIQQRHQFLNLPNMIRDPRFHRRCNAERLVDAAESFS